MKARILCVAALAAAACDHGPSFKSTCTAAAPSADALVPAEHEADGSIILPDGRRLTPAGTVATIGGFPLAMRVLPQDERYIVVTDGAYGDEALRIVDTAAPAGSDPVVSSIAYPKKFDSAADKALFYGLALTADGSRVYVSDGGYDPGAAAGGTTHENVIEAIDIAGSPPQLTPAEQIELPFAGTSATTPRYPAGLALSSDNKLYVATQYDGTLAVVDVAPGPNFGVEIGRSMELGIAPYDVVLDEATHTAFLSLWGGRYSGGQFANGVVAVDVGNPMQPAPGTLIATDKAPEQMILSGGKIYVAAADGDSIGVIDPVAQTAAQTPVGFDASGLYGSTPNALAADVAHDRLYVANAGENAVQAFQLSTMTSLGRIPTAWYPTAVAVRSDGTLYIAAAKGLGAGPTSTYDRGQNDYMQGTLEVVPLPSDDDLRSGDVTVHDNLMRPKHYEVALTCTGTPSFPLPPTKDAPSPIEHTFLIVRENKTFDVFLGDLPGVHGDPSLTLFGADNTPNLHALAKQFTVLDNFYDLSEQSLQGHEWTTAAMANDYTEKGWLTTFGRGTRSEGGFSGSEELSHLAQPASPTAFERLDAAGVAYHNYGEIENIVGAATQPDPGYPGIFFDLDILDVDKADYITFNLRDKRFALEPFSYIGLPNDYTYGTSVGKPTPQSMVADNDEATGRIIDALSRSSYWASSVVFIMEDDPNDGGDHVEMHRTPAVVVSPWARHGYVSSVHYDVPALWHTITLLLHVDPINQRDGNAPAMYDVFSPKPDTSTYTVIPRKIPVATNSADAPMAKESGRIDFSRPDTAPLGRILWKAVKGRDSEPPWAGRRPPPPTRDDDD